MINNFENSLLVKTICSQQMDFTDKTVVEVENKKTTQGEINKNTLKGRVSKLPEKEKDRLLEALNFLQEKKDSEKRQEALREKGLCVLLLMDDHFPKEKEVKTSGGFLNIFRGNKDDQIIKSVEKVREIFKKQNLGSNLENKIIISSLDQEIQSLKKPNIEFAEKEEAEKALKELSQLIGGISTTSKPETFFNILKDIRILIKIIENWAGLNKGNKDEGDQVFDKKIESYENIKNLLIPDGNKIQIKTTSEEGKNKEFCRIIDVLNELKSKIKNNINGKDVNLIKLKFQELNFLFEKQVKCGIFCQEKKSEDNQLIQWRLSKFISFSQMVDSQKNIENTLNYQSVLEQIKFCLSKVDNSDRTNLIESLENIHDFYGDKNKFFNELLSEFDNQNKPISEVVWKKFYIAVAASINILRKICMEDPFVRESVSINQCAKDELLYLAKSIDFNEINKWETSKSEKFLKIKNGISNYIQKSPNIFIRSMIDMIKNCFLFFSDFCDVELEKGEKLVSSIKNEVKESGEAIKMLNIKYGELWAQDPKLVKGYTGFNSETVTEKESFVNKNEINIENNVISKNNNPLPKQKNNIKSQISTNSNILQSSTQPLTAIQKLEIPQQNQSYSTVKNELIRLAISVQNSYLPNALAQEKCAKIYWEQIGQDKLPVKSQGVSNTVFGNFYQVLKSKDEIVKDRFGMGENVFLEQDFPNEENGVRSWKDCIQQIDHETVNYYRLLAMVKTINELK